LDNQSTAYSAYEEYEKIRKEAKRKMRKKAILITSIAVGIVLLGLPLLFFGLSSVMKGSDAYKAATHYISQNEMILAHSGGIEEFGSFPTFEITTENGYGTADFDISVKGKKRDLDVSVHLEKVPDSEWKVTEMEIENQ